MSIQVGQKAPEFNLEGVLNGEFKPCKLSDNKGKWTVLFFYPLDFTFVCPTEIIAFSEAADKFKALNANVYAASIDSKFTHLAWLNTPKAQGGLGKINFPLLSDINKTVSADYGVLLPGGMALRGLFIIDDEGVLQYSVVHNLSVGRSVDETLRVLEAFQYASSHPGEVCPANWTKGADTMKNTPKESLEYFKKHG